MKKSFSDEVFTIYGIPPKLAFDIVDLYDLYFERELREAVNKEKKEWEQALKDKVRAEILQEKLYKNMDNFCVDLKFLRSFVEKASSLSHKHGNVTLRKSTNLPIYDLLWISIRKWQRDTGTSNTELARILGISQRTLSDYDKSARTMTLEKLTKFLDSIGGVIKIVY